MAQLSELEILFIILAGSAGMLLLIVAIGIFIFVYQRRLYSDKLEKIEQEKIHEQSMIKAQLESQETERVRIGEDLHDSLGSLLWGAKVNAAFIEQSVKLEGQVKDSYEELNQILDQSISTVRRISWELTPNAFHHSGLSQSIEKLCHQLNGKGIDIKFNEIGSFNWNDTDGLQVYRIVQELVSNAMKHSRAKTVSVSLQWTENELEVIVDDNGIGFRPGNERRGVGWWNIEQRAKRLNAKISIGDSTIVKGSHITLHIPLKNGKKN